MKRLFDLALDLRPAIIGTSTTVALDYLNSVVGILVGLATLVYLMVRGRKRRQVLTLDTSTLRSS